MRKWNGKLIRGYSQFRECSSTGRSESSQKGGKDEKNPSRRGNGKRKRPDRARLSIEINSRMENIKLTTSVLIRGPQRTRVRPVRLRKNFLLSRAKGGGKNEGAAPSQAGDTLTFEEPKGGSNDTIQRSAKIPSGKKGEKEKQGSKPLSLSRLKVIQGDSLI